MHHEGVKRIVNLTRIQTTLPSTTLMEVVFLKYNCFRCKWFVFVPAMPSKALPLTLS